MKTTILIFSTLLFLGLSACDKEDQNDSEADYLIFGRYYGFCQGETCIETYKLTNTKLYEDINDPYAGFNPFDFVVLANSDFLIAEDLDNLFPQTLLSVPDTTFGCPDCADQGGMFLQYSSNGHLQTWRLDQFQNDVPSYLHSYMDLVNAKIDSLSF